MAKNHMTKVRAAVKKASAGAKAGRIAKKTTPAKGSVTLQLNPFLSAPISTAAFREAAKVYTVKATKTRASAVDTLKRERILTKSGAFAKAFS